MGRRMRVGDQITVGDDVPAWYSSYGMNPVRVIRPGEPLTITAVNVPVVRKLKGSPSNYMVARTNDGWQISTIETPFLPI